MRIRLDDEVISLDDDIIEEGKEAIYNEAKRIAVSRNRVITETILDGEGIDDLDVFFSLSSGQDIQFVTQPVRALVHDSMAEGSKYFPSLFVGLENVATKFEAKKDQEAQGLLAQAIDGINWLFGVFDRTCILMAVTTDSLESGDFTKDSEDIKSVLDEMTSTMEEGKNLKLAYVIREKLIPALRSFSTYWDEVAKSLESPLQ